MTALRPIGLVLAFVLASACTPPVGAPHWQRIPLDPSSKEQPLLEGPPQTAGMRSGRVVLRPGEDMHRHTTGAHEELLMFLQGRATVVVAGTPVEMAAGEVLYIPPNTIHEVHNGGTEEARYIYAVAPTR